MNLCRVLPLHIFGSSGLPSPKSLLRYFITVVAMAFLVSSPTKFENSASGMCRGGVLEDVLESTF